MPLTLAMTAYESGQVAARATMALLIVLLVRRFLRRLRASDAVAAIVLAVLLVGALVRASGGSDVDTAAAGASGGSASWSSAYGTNMRAGFMDGCRENMSGEVDCRCLFSKLTSEPSYSTPPGLRCDGERAAGHQGDPGRLQARPGQLPDHVTPEDGRGGFRTCDLSRLKRNPGDPELPPEQGRLFWFYRDFSTGDRAGDRLRFPPTSS